MIVRTNRRAIVMDAHRPVFRGLSLVALVALLFAMLTAISVAVPAQVARAAGTVCPPGSIYANTGGDAPALNKYSTTGTLQSSAPLTRAYGDIAFSGDGLTLYGVKSTANSSNLYSINPLTGAETATVAITGSIPAGSYLNALSALPNGNLLTGDSVSTAIYQINPTTGVSTLYNAAFPTGFWSAGDFLSLADGDILAVAASSSGNALFRIHPAGTLTEIGTVPVSFGAAQSGGNIYLAGSTGNLYQVTSLPTAASTAPLATTTIAATALSFYGATSQQDSGLCSNLTVAKTSTPAAGTAITPGQLVTYSITLSNATGTAPATVDQTDNLSAVLDDATVTAAPTVASGTALTLGSISNGSFRITGVIPVGGQTTLTYTVRVNDPDTGDHVLSNYVVNTGSAPPTSCVATDTTCTTSPVSDLTLTKTATPSAATAYMAGQVVTYSFLVKNTGAVTLSNVTVTDTGFTGSGTLGPITPTSVASLTPGSSTTFTATYTITQADVDRGTITNNATATGTPPSGTPPVSPPSTVTIPHAQTPSIAVVKSASPTTITAAGQPITYSFVVTNTGNVTLTNATVTETAFSGTGTAPVITCPAGAASLVPGAQVTCTATYTATQADVNAGQITNTATATGTPPTGTPVTSAPSSAIVTATAAPAITVVKSASPSDAAHFTVGQVVTYSFVVTNTGNVTLSNVTVNEGTFTGSGTLSAITCPAGAASLAPGAQVTCTATYTITQADVDAGSIANDATATGIPPSGLPPVSPPSTVTIPAAQTPAITVVKSADRATVDTVGQVVTYSFLVTNTGNVTLAGVAVNEGTFTGSGTLSPVTCPAGAASLVPGAQITCTATYTATQADVGAGQITNTATATGTPPTGTPVTSDPSSALVTVPPTPALTVVKSASPSDQAHFTVGQVITYSFVVTNTGNVTLTNVTVDEGTFTGSGTLSTVTCPAGAASLAPGAQVACTATYTITQADVDRGSITNDATATGTPPSGLPPVSPPSTVTVPAPQDPAVTVVKTANRTTISTPGQVVTYSFVVTNTGNVTLTNPTVEEGAFTGAGTLSPVVCPSAAAILLPGVQVTCTAAYTVLAADLTGKTLANTATVTGTPPGGTPISSPPSTARVSTPPGAAVKTGGYVLTPAGPSLGWLWELLAALGLTVAAAAAVTVLARRRRLNGSL